MHSMRQRRTIAFAFMLTAILVFFAATGHAQAALLMEEPYGVFGSVNPTGHNAIYFQRICAETPVKLRRCNAGELGAVIARYQGIDGYDWVAIPLIPYLYSVEKPSDVPARVNREKVHQLRDRYHEAHLLSLGEDLSPGSFLHCGWAQLIGLSYERRMYAFRFETTEAQDDALITYMNAGKNRSHFYLLFNNCADFARLILNFYFPGSFQRSVVPDAFMASPKQIVYKLERYAVKHPEVKLAIYEIPQIPGYRHMSRKNKSIAESLSTTGYAAPIIMLNPYLAGGLFVDYLALGHHHLIPKNLPLVTPETLFLLTAPAVYAENPDSADVQAPSAANGGSPETPASRAANSGLTEIKVVHE
jgi:hypothetical protein